MTKTLVVTKPFYMLEIGDTLDLSSDGTSYESSYNEEMGNSIDDGSDIYGSYSSTFKISKAYADELMQKGYLKADDTDTNKSTFVNVFSECMKVEKTTVLDNMITVLNHLKNLKK